jgi:hypothetical protein
MSSTTETSNVEPGRSRVSDRRKDAPTGSPAVDGLVSGRSATCGSGVASRAKFEASTPGITVDGVRWGASAFE